MGSSPSAAASATAIAGGFRVATVRSSGLIAPNFRLDAKHYQEEFVLAKNRVLGCGLAIRPVADLAHAFVAKRTKLITVPQSEAGAPYLKAHDAFAVRPESNRHMVASRTPDYEDYLLKEGMILTPSSGRNLGPIAYVGRQLSRFAMTDIMRIVPEDPDVGFYLLAYLLTPTAQALIRRGRTGTNVDHLAPGDLLEIPVVWLDDDRRFEFSESMRKAENLLARIREKNQRA